MRGHFLRAATTTPLTPRLTFSTATTAWLTAVEAADNDADSLGPMNDGVWNAKGTLADAFAPLCPTGTLVFGDGARSLGGALIQAQGASPIGVNLVPGDWDGRSFGLTRVTSKHINTTVSFDTLPENDSHISVVSAGGGPEFAGNAFLIGGTGEPGAIQYIRTAANELRVRIASSLVSIFTPAADPFIFPPGTYGLFRNNAANFTRMVENAATVLASTSVAPLVQDIRIGANATGANGIDIRVCGYTLGTYVDPIVLRDLLNTATASITAALA